MERFEFTGWYYFVHRLVQRLREQNPKATSIPDFVKRLTIIGVFSGEVISDYSRNSNKKEEAAEAVIHSICGYAKCKLAEMSLKNDHAHLFVMIPPKVTISDLVGREKEKTSLRLFQKFRQLIKKPY